MTVLFGIDVGTSRDQGPRDHTRRRSGRHRGGALPPVDAKPGWSEQDPEDWWRATETVLEKLDEHRRRARRHRTVRPDARARRAGRERRRHPPRDPLERPANASRVRRDREHDRPRTADRTHRQPRADRLHRAEDPVAPQRTSPTTTQSIASVLLPKDYVRLRLTGEHATDVSDASGTLLLDVANRTWSDEVLQALEHRPGLAADSAREPGAIRAHEQDGVPVAAGGGDQAAGAVGVGVDRKGPVSVALGTSRRRVRRARRIRGGQASPRPRVLPRGPRQAWHAMGVMLSAAGSLSWLRNAAGPGHATSTRCSKKRTNGRRAPKDLIFLPYLAGERTPYADPDARGAFVGLGLRHDRGALTRAVLEGVAFGLQRLARPHRRARWRRRNEGASPVAARAAGCGRRSSPRCSSCRSSRGGRRGRRVRRGDPRRGGGGRVAGRPHRGADKPSSRASAIEPVPDWIEPYREQRERFRALYPALKAVR